MSRMSMFRCRADHQDTMCKEWDRNVARVIARAPSQGTWRLGFVDISKICSEDFADAIIHLSGADSFVATICPHVVRVSMPYGSREVFDWLYMNGRGWWCSIESNEYRFMDVMTAIHFKLRWV